LNISQVQVDQLEQVWPNLLPMVARGLRHGQGDSLAPCDILHSLKSGDMILWIAHEDQTLYGGMVFQVSQSPRKKTVFVVILAGVEFERWANDMQAVLIEYQKGIGADCIEASCRKGMARKLERLLGWKAKAIIMEAPHGG